ncbi:hypothetical protein ACQJBY_070622 [Aegilops geniculata]
MALRAASPPCAAGRCLPSSPPPRVGGRHFFRPLSSAAPAPLRKSAAISNSDGTPGTSDSPHVVCFGELLIDFVPTVSGVSLADAPAFKKAPGGAPANVAVGIARLGGSAAFIGKVGDDEFGYMLSDMLKENNVNNQGLLFDTHARTALAFVTLRSDGEREFMFYRNPSADMLLEEKELDLDLIRKAKIFHHGSISLITEPCKTAHIAASKAAKDAGVLISYDPNLRLPLWTSADDARDGILSIWDTADLIKVSAEEISFLTNGEDPYDDSVVKKLIHPNTKLLLVTEGPDGCRYYSKEFSGKVGGLKVTAVDTTGAGDAFVAGILSQLAADFSLLQVALARLLQKFSNVWRYYVVGCTTLLPRQKSNKIVPVSKKNHQKIILYQILRNGGIFCSS